MGAPPLRRLPADGVFCDDSARSRSWTPRVRGLGESLIRRGLVLLGSRLYAGRPAWLLSVLLAAAPAATLAQGVPVTCSSSGERTHCAADTSAGILMTRQLSDAACLLGKTWGYDD